MPILVGISGCLLGERVRYDGDHKRSRYCTDELSRYVQYIKICPEVAAGMSVPRPTIRLERHANEIRAVIPTTGADVTAALTHVADRQYHQLGQLSGYVLCTKSRECKNICVNGILNNIEEGYQNANIRQTHRSAA